MSASCSRDIVSIDGAVQRWYDVRYVAKKVQALPQMPKRKRCGCANCIRPCLVEQEKARAKLKEQQGQCEHAHRRVYSEGPRDNGEYYVVCVACGKEL